MSNDEYGWAFRQLDAVGDLSRLSRPARTVVALISADGIIVNGGFQLFFESDWPDGTAHEDFALFYFDAGLKSHASIISMANALVGDIARLSPDGRALVLTKHADELEALSAKYWELSEQFDQAIQALKILGSDA